MGDFEGGKLTETYLISSKIGLLVQDIDVKFWKGLMFGNYIVYDYCLYLLFVIIQRLPKFSVETIVINNQFKLIKFY